MKDISQSSEEPVRICLGWCLVPLNDIENKSFLILYIQGPKIMWDGTSICIACDDSFGKVSILEPSFHEEKTIIWQEIALISFKNDSLYRLWEYVKESLQSGWKDLHQETWQRILTS